MSNKEEGDNKAYQFRESPLYGLREGGEHGERPRELQEVGVN